MVDRDPSIFKKLEEVAEPNERLVKPDGMANDTWWRWFWRLWRDTNENFQSAGVNDDSAATAGRLAALEEQVRDLLGRESTAQQTIAVLQQEIAATCCAVQQQVDALPFFDGRALPGSNASEPSGGQHLIADTMPEGGPDDLAGRLTALENAVLGIQAREVGVLDPPWLPPLETGHLTVRDYFERFATVTANRSAANGTGNQIVMAGSASGASPLAPVSLSAAAGSTDTNVGVAIVPKGSGAFTLAVPDNGTGGGNVRGANAVDLQTVRSAATAVAAGANSLTAGTSNTVSGSAGVALGNSNNVSGAASVALGLGNAASGAGTIVEGSRGTDRGTNGSRVLAPGRFSVSGDVQFQEADFFVTTAGAVAVRLTTDGATAAATNVMVLPNNSGYAVECLCIIRDVTSGKQLVYMRAGGLIERGANAAATALGATPPVFVLLDSSAAAPALAVIPTLTADTTLGGLNISYTPPLLNTDTFHAHCYVRAVQVL